MQNNDQLSNVYMFFQITIPCQSKLINLSENICNLILAAADKKTKSNDLTRKSGVVSIRGHCRIKKIIDALVKIGFSEENFSQDKSSYLDDGGYRLFINHPLSESDFNTKLIQYLSKVDKRFNNGNTVAMIQRYNVMSHNRSIGKDYRLIHIDDKYEYCFALTKNQASYLYNNTINSIQNKFENSNEPDLNYLQKKILNAEDRAEKMAYIIQENLQMFYDDFFCFENMVTVSCRKLGCA